MPKQEGLDKSSGDYALNHSIALPLMGGNNRFGLSMQGCGIKLPNALFLRGANRMELFSGELSTAISTRGITKRGLCACIVVRRRNKLSGGPHSCHQPGPLFFSISQLGGSRPGGNKKYSDLVNCTNGAEQNELLNA